MNKSAIQRFAIWARTELIAQVSQRAYQYGITEEGYGEADAVTVRGRALTPDEVKQRKELVGQIRSKNYKQVMEEAAYTWFNRFVALRFMEVNNYLPSHVRLFSDSTGAFKPEILANAIHLDMTGLDKDKIAAYIQDNKTEELYLYLLITQCNALNEAMPQMFEKIGGYTELLFPNNILRAGSVIGRMVSDIPEEDWTDQVQIIGWLYQYYNSELKDETFALLKNNVKITKERIPSATQLFTPDWIVRYMVENSLGRLWIEGHPDDELKAGWKYYLDEAIQEAAVQVQLDAIRAECAALRPQDIKVIDPCAGSGHILVYAFDVLMQIYKKQGYSERDAAQSILLNNLYGLDIDDRAAQLAYFAVMMKARQYDRRIFSRNIQPHVYPIAESNELDDSTIDYFAKKDQKLKENLRTLVKELSDAKDYGSILDIPPIDFDALYARAAEILKSDSIFKGIVSDTILPMIQTAELLSQKYDIVITNPPYMGSSGMNEKLCDYVKRNYPDSKSDLFAIFIERCGVMTADNRYYAMITQHAWMFLSSYEKLRNKLLMADIVNMVHLGPRAFEEIGGEVVQTTSFVIRKSHIADYRTTYCRLIEPTSQQGKKDMFLAGKNRYTALQSNFSQIPGLRIAYWVSEKLLSAFKYTTLYEYSVSPSQNVTGNNAKYVRKHWELECTKIGSKDGWIFYAKGGGYRKWWGNLENVVDWTPDARNVYQYGDGIHASQIINQEYWYKRGITWGLITSLEPSFRVMPKGATYDKGGSTIIVVNKVYCFTLALLNSKVYIEILKIFNQTNNSQVNDVRSVPLILTNIKRINRISLQCIKLAKIDWDSFETSWDFNVHPLVLASYAPDLNGGHKSAVAEAFAKWEKVCNDRFTQLKANEEELNRIFIDIYGLQDELTPEVMDEDVTVRKADLGRDIRSLVSYAVGCMFGRYSLDESGLAYAGGSWDESKYSTFTPSGDNIIPICDEDYLEGDITARFVKWVETVYGSEKLEENLKFIADAVGGTGMPREVIRKYFLKDFFDDHCKIYQKRPIYWLFDSGKKNGFKALIYMHRYRSDLLARMRTEYIHEMQERYRTQLAMITDALNNATGAERTKLTKRQGKIQEQAQELQMYEEKIHHLADKNISINLDDGVKHNYALFSDVLAKIK
mgnify:CR=1 FL=1